MNNQQKLSFIFYLIVLIFNNKISFSQNFELFEKAVYIQNQDTLPYRFLTPVTIADSDLVFPLVIFLHGSGERGNENEKQLIHGSKLFLNLENRKNFPAYVIFPQCPEGKRWAEVDWKADKQLMPAEPSVPMRLTIAMIDSCIKKNPVDTSRIYIMGLSMGGFGTWDMISRFPDKFAAAAPICGGGDENQAPKIKNMPIWAFHGAIDKVVKVQRSRNMINALKKAGGNPKYTEYPKTGHDAWNKAFEEKELLKWLFSKHK